MEKKLNVIVANIKLLKYNKTKWLKGWIYYERWKERNDIWRTSEAKKNFEALNEQLNKVKKEEEERKRAKLEAEKNTRYKEIEEVSKHLNQLISDYTKDYGRFSFTRSYSNNDDYKYDFPYLYHWFFWLWGYLLMRK